MRRNHSGWFDSSSWNLSLLRDAPSQAGCIAQKGRCGSSTGSSEISITTPTCSAKTRSIKRLSSTSVESFAFPTRPYMIGPFLTSRLSPRRESGKNSRALQFMTGRVRGTAMIYSYSQISQYLRCPRSYRFRYLHEWQEKETRAAMVVGRFFEKALHAYFSREDSA